MTLGWLLVLVIDFWALLRCWGSTLSPSAKFLWTLVIFFFPIGGVILYILFGRANPLRADDTRGRLAGKKQFSARPTGVE